MASALMARVWIVFIVAQHNNAKSNRFARGRSIDQEEFHGGSERPFSTEGGVRHQYGRRAVAGDRVRRSGLFADHLSYGARWGNPPFAGGQGASGGAPRLAPSS
ncbi:unnamed protein product [Pleuronectes platessa]|uniref:Secreted protein n=1 Tax=Pleuronectes platessa TaxID=8262 RepID=A0A9N7YBW9_PLEPL|nr:unnamed protein product [Pleuronectes platessa]